MTATRSKDGCGPALRQPTAAEQQAEEFRNLQVGGTDLKKAVDTVLAALHWHTDLDAALADAKQQSKPILWIHALGDIDGYL